jgi:hypothetical protein
MADEKQVVSEEFFYLDDDGKKQDAELHGPIIAAVDNPIDEAIMKPIRERHRKAWLARERTDVSRLKE